MFEYDDKWSPPCEAGQIFHQFKFEQAFEKIAKCDQYEYWLALENACSNMMQKAIMSRKIKMVGHFSVLEVRFLYNHAKQQRDKMQRVSLQKHRLHEQAVYHPTPDNQKHKLKDGKDGQTPEENPSTPSRVHGKRSKARIL